MRIRDFGLAVVTASSLLLALAASAAFAVFLPVDGSVDSEQFEFEVSDKPAPESGAYPAIASERTMPIYLQDDPQWSHVPYAGATVADSGCGLVAASMAIQYLTNQVVDPLSLLGSVGDSCTVDGVNDMSLFCEYMADAYGIGCSGIYFDDESALDAVESGGIVFASVSGTLGSEYYGGHIVLVWLCDGDCVYIRDPASGCNSQRVFSRDEFRSVNWVYFYSMDGGDMR